MQYFTFQVCKGTIKDTRSENRIVISVTIIILQLKISANVENFLYALFHSKNGTTNEIAQTFKKDKAESSNTHRRVICNYAAQYNVI